MLQKKNKRILICETRDLSYGSSGFFLQQITAALQKRGVLTEYFKLKKDLSNIDDLEYYADRSFDAVLDINSYLPTMVMEDGSYLIDRIHAPFFNYIVDHPIHLHPLLDSRAKRYYVICLDPAHRKYIRTMYPQIAGCYVLPLAGTIPGSCKPYEDRDWHIYFPGTYVPLAEYKTKLKEPGTKEGTDPDLLHLAEEYCCRLAEEPCLPDITEWYLNRREQIVCSAEQLHFTLRYLDRYAREVIRHRVLDALLAEGYSIHVTGAHWQYYEGRYQDCLTVHPQCDYPSMLTCMGNSQVVLNVQPLFNRAPHDRILCAMAGGAVSLTDSCVFLDENMEMGRHYLRYDSRHPGRSFHKLHKWLDHPDALSVIAGEGKEKTRGNYLWEHWTEKFLDIIDKQIVTG